MRDFEEFIVSKYKEPKVSLGGGNKLGEFMLGASLLPHNYNGIKPDSANVCFAQFTIRIFDLLEYLTKQIESKTSNNTIHTLMVSLYHIMEILEPLDSTQEERYERKGTQESKIRNLINERKKKS